MSNRGLRVTRSPSIHAATGDDYNDPRFKIKVFLHLSFSNLINDPAVSFQRDDPEGNGDGAAQPYGRRQTLLPMCSNKETVNSSDLLMVANLSVQNHFPEALEQDLVVVAQSVGSLPQVQRVPVLVVVCVAVAAAAVEVVVPPLWVEEADLPAELAPHSFAK